MRLTSEFAGKTPTTMFSTLLKATPAPNYSFQSRDTVHFSGKSPGEKQSLRRNDKSHPFRISGHQTIEQYYHSQGWDQNPEHLEKTVETRVSVANNAWAALPQAERTREARKAAREVREAERQAAREAREAAREAEYAEREAAREAELQAEVAAMSEENRRTYYRAMERRDTRAAGRILKDHRRGI